METKPQPIKHNSLTTVTPLSKYLAMTLFIVLPFIGVYLGYKYGVILPHAKDQNLLQIISENPVTQGTTVKTYPTGDKKLVIFNNETPFTVLVPNEWDITVIENNYGLDIRNGEYAIKLTTGSLGTSLCIYQGDELYGNYDPEAKSPYQYPEFSNYTEIKTSDTVYRRGESQYDQEAQNENDASTLFETVCEYTSSSDTYVNDIKIGGKISYSYPKIHSSLILQQMDEILSSITLVPKETTD